MTEKLKPCPFCGGERLGLSAYDVTCRDCKASMPAADAYVACERWNRRTPDPAVNVGTVKDASSDYYDDTIILHNGLKAATDEILRLYRVYIADDRTAYPRAGQMPAYDNSLSILAGEKSALSTPPQEAGEAETPAPSAGSVRAEHGDGVLFGVALSVAFLIRDPQEGKPEEGENPAPQVDVTGWQPMETVPRHGGKIRVIDANGRTSNVFANPEAFHHFKLAYVGWTTFTGGSADA